MEGFLNPNQALGHLKLKSDMTAADFGCGSGGWAIPLAKRLEDGTVYAIDILEEPLSALRSKMNLEKIRNIRTIRSNVENKNGSTLPNSSVDLVLMTNLLFQIEDKKAVISEAKRVLKNGGKILVVDWKEDSPQGPEKGRVSEKEVKKITEDLGFDLEKEFEAGIYHYGLVFVKH
jgi:ubiquinone/menaquinone biosynthesis C-methylase UbiE